MDQRKRWRFASLDLGRALACLLVVVYHAGGTASLPKYFGEHSLSGWAAIGYVRMPFFFAMSGFLLSWLYLQRAPAQGAAAPVAFLARRAAHLYPLYWVALCSVAAVQIFVLRQPVPTGWDWVQTVLLLPQSPAEAGGTGAPVLYPAWVLQYEIVGYLFVALALWRPVLRRAYLLAFPALYVLLSDADAFVPSFLGSKWLLIFWMGAAAAWTARHANGRHRAIALALSLLWLSGAGTTQYFADPVAQGLTDLDVHYGLGFALSVIFLAGIRRGVAMSQPRRPLHRAVETLARWSYAIFLCHAPVISMVCKMALGAGLHGDAGWEIAVLGCIAVSIGLGGLLHQWVERPLDRCIARSFETVRQSWRQARQRVRAAARSRHSRARRPVARVVAPVRSAFRAPAVRHRGASKSAR